MYSVPRPWAIYNLDTSPAAKVADFRKRSDADAYLSTLRRLSTARYQIVYLTKENTDTTVSIY